MPERKDDDEVLRRANADALQRQIDRLIAGESDEAESDPSLRDFIERKMGEEREREEKRKGGDVEGEEEQEERGS